MDRPAAPLTHEWIWLAIDALADRQGLSPSALARLAGLDPTTFNRSKRFTPEGRPRWPSTESLSKLLQATGTSLDEFASIEVDLSKSCGEDAEINGTGCALDTFASAPEGVEGPASANVAQFPTRSRRRA